MRPKKILAELSVAVAKVREASRISQEGFGRDLGVATMTISRWERGQQVPSDFRVLNRLESMARHLGLAREADLFDRARSGVRFNAYRQGTETPAELASLPVWRLTVAVRVASVYFPERVPEIEKALDSALAIVDAILRSTDQLDYRRLEREVFSLAEKQTLEQLKRQDVKT